MPLAVDRYRLEIRLTRPYSALLSALALDQASVVPRECVEAKGSRPFALSIVQMLQYWTRSIPSANTSWDQYRESFLRFR